MYITVGHAIINHLCRAILCVIIEVHRRPIRYGHMYDVFTTQHIIGHDVALFLLHSQAIGIILIFHHATSVSLANQLSARLPIVCPARIRSNVANSVADHRVTIYIDYAGRQFVFPVSILVQVLFYMVRRTQRASGAGIVVLLILN